MKPQTSSCLTLGLIVSSSFVLAENWPQWRGPLANGVAPNANPPTTWSESSNVKWKVALPGKGTSTPIIWGDKVFVTSAIPTGKKATPAPTAATPAPPATPAPAATAPPAAPAQAAPAPPEGLLRLEEPLHPRRQRRRVHPAHLPGVRPAEGASAVVPEAALRAAEAPAAEGSVAAEGAANLRPRSSNSC